jgi:glycosyltransferase involved in cell wall biosynthesis
MGSQDGVDLLLKAARIIVDRGRTDMHFLLVGDGPEYASLVALTRKLGLDDFVTFTGRQSGEILCQSFSTADIGVCPDPKNDFNDRLAMNKVMEYMTFGLPVVQFSLTENMRLVGDAGLNVGGDNYPEKMADAIIQLGDDDALRQKLGEAGRRRMAEELTWDRQVPNLLEAYDKLWP